MIKGIRYRSKKDRFVGPTGGSLVLFGVGLSVVVGGTIGVAAGVASAGALSRSPDTVSSSPLSARSQPTSRPTG